MFVFQKISSNPILKWSIALIGIILLIIIGFRDSPETVSFSNPFSIFQFDSTLSAKIAFPLSLALTYFIYLSILKIDQEHRFTDKSNFILAFGFFLALFSYPQILFNTGAFIVTILLLESLKSMLEIHSQVSVFKLIFKASTLASLSSLIFFPSSYFLLVIFGSIAIFRPFNLKNFVLVLIAWSLPYFYIFCFTYLLDLNLEIPFQQVFNQSLLNIFSEGFSSGIIDFVLKGGLILLAIIAMLSSFAIKQKLIVRKRNQLSIVFFATLMFAILTIIYGIYYCFILSFSFGSILLALYYQSFEKKWLIESCLILLLFLAIGVHFFS